MLSVTVSSDLGAIDASRSNSPWDCGVNLKGTTFREGDRLTGDDLVVQLEHNLGGLSSETLRAHADRDRYFIFHKADVRGKKVAHDNVARRGDADAKDVERNTFLPRHRGSFSSRTDTLPCPCGLSAAMRA